MIASDETDREHIALILEMIAHIDRRLGHLSAADFETDRDEIDLTAYRLAVIGETTQRLSAALKQRHPEILWQAIYAMRNIIVHNYAGSDPVHIWRVATTSLAALAAVCRVELSP